MQHCLISVIIPVHNAEDYICTCLESVLHQTMQDIEIVLVNDGSTDGTTELLRDYSGKYPNITLVEKKQGGVLSARHTGLLNSRGEYVGWVDADDFIEPDMYEALYNLAVNEKADYVYCDYNFYPAEVKTKAKWFKEWRGEMDWMFLERNTQCWKSLTRKDLLDNLNIADKFLRYGEYAWMSVILNAKKIAYTTEKLYNYRVGHVSLSSAHFEGRVAKFKSGVDQALHLKDLLLGTKYESALSEYFDYRYYYTLLQLEIVAASNKDKAAYKEAANALSKNKFKSNKYLKPILDYNHGKLKSFVIRNMITMSYYLAVIITRFV